MNKVFFAGRQCLLSEKELGIKQAGKSEVKSKEFHTQ
jgi:hypothetical protein